MVMMNLRHMDTAMTDQPEPAPSKVDRRSWAERARALIGAGGGQGRQVIGIVLGGLLLAGSALLWLTWTLRGSCDPGGPDRAHVRPKELSKIFPRILPWRASQEAIRDAHRFGRAAG
jgi:hypothetical protein